MTAPFRTWRKLYDRTLAHGKLDYHLASLAKMSAFLDCYSNPSQAIDTVLVSEARKRMEANKKVISSTLKIVLLCGKQGIAFCGYRDDCFNWEDTEYEHSNPGNFIELVCFRAETDNILSEHLKNSLRNARYTPKTIQNELIEVVGKYICNEIIAEVKKSKCYTVVVDEVTDISNKEQLSISLRYVYYGTVKEVFIAFVSVERITGKNIAAAILNWIQTVGLSTSDMRGQCYDGASNMSRARSECSAVIQQQAPKAAYFHCAAHRLNLAVVSACKIQAFMNVEAYIGEIARFFAFSPKRQRLFYKTMDKFLLEAKAQKLKDACRTRWVQCIDSYTVILELLPAFHTSLQAMVSPGQHKDFGTDWGWNGNTITKANGYLYQLQPASFLVCFKILLEILQCLKGLTVKLQMQASVRLILQKMRKDCVQEFNKIFAESVKLGQDLHGEDFELTKPRISRRQSHRSNIEACSAEQYYCVTMYNEFLSHVIRELDNRFSGNQYLVHGLLHLVPSKVASESHDDFPETLSQSSDYFKDDLPHHDMLSIEYRMWVRKWKCSDEVPTKLVDALKSCDEIQFPNIFVLLKLTLTLPVTTCECERSFSQLKLIKTCRRSTMTDDRLNGLAIMKLNSDRCERIRKSPEALNLLLNSFASLHPKGMKIAFVLADQ